MLFVMIYIIHYMHLYKFSSALDHKIQEHHTNIEFSPTKNYRKVKMSQYKYVWESTVP